MRVPFKQSQIFIFITCPLRGGRKTSETSQYSRIIVEFQYSDRNYARSVFHANTEYENTQYRLRANYFIEQDSKNQPFLLNLTDSNKSLMASVGDNINNALAPTAISTREFLASKILYRKIDSLSFPDIFIYAPSVGNDSIFSPQKH